jgi:hypothetical protein
LRVAHSRRVVLAAFSRGGIIKTEFYFNEPTACPFAGVWLNRSASMNQTTWMERATDEEFREQLEVAKAGEPAIACPRCRSLAVICLELSSAIQHPFNTALVAYRCECGFDFTVAFHGDGTAPHVWRDDSTSAPAEHGIAR